MQLRNKIMLHCTSAPHAPDIFEADYIIWNNEECVVISCLLDCCLVC